MASSTAVLTTSQFVSSGGVVNTARFQSEIVADPLIITALVGCTLRGTELSVEFKAELSEAEEAQLVTLAAVHSGLPLPPRKPIQQVEFPEAQQVHLDCPSEPDRKPVMVNSPATEGTFTWLSSCSDDLNPTPPTSGRGTGTKAFISFADAGNDERIIQFIEPVELHDGHVSWRGAWDFEDSWSISIRMAATIAVPNVDGTGNCNLVATPFGFNVIVPAANDGAYDIDLATAVPVPDGYTAKTNTGQGFWNVDQYWSEEVSPAGDGKGGFNFYDIPIEMFFCRNMDCGNPLGVWDLDAYKAEWVSSRRQIAFTVDKVTAGAGKIGGYLMVFRPGAL
ncbi:hypothetical protein KJ782_07185 [Patescibacteria group bacterium]|nr:hypothetical protein [Patescibacteria group bacterium]